MERELFINAVREFAQFLEENEFVPLPISTRFDAFFYSKEDFQRAAKVVGGKLDKKDYGSLMVLRKEFGPIQFDLNIDREQICERVITGKRIVPEVPAVPEHEEDVVEWKCGVVLEPAQ